MTFNQFKLYVLSLNITQNEEILLVAVWSVLPHTDLVSISLVTNLFEKRVTEAYIDRPPMSPLHARHTSVLEEMGQLRTACYVSAWG